MADNTDDNSQPKPKAKARRPRRLTPEETWVRGFLGFSGTANVTRIWLDDLDGVNIIRAAEALVRGHCVSVEKCDGPGCVCVFKQVSDDDAVEVTIYFVAAEAILEIRGARVITEVRSEPDAA